MLINLCSDATAGRDDTDRKARAIDRRANRTVDVDMINSRVRGECCQWTEPVFLDFQGDENLKIIGPAAK